MLPAFIMPEKPTKHRRNIFWRNNMTWRYSQMQWKHCRFIAWNRRKIDAVKIQRYHAFFIRFLPQKRTKEMCYYYNEPKRTGKESPPDVETARIVLRSSKAFTYRPPAMRFKRIDGWKVWDINMESSEPRAEICSRLLLCQEWTNRFD